MWFLGLGIVGIFPIMVPTYLSFCADSKNLYLDTSLWGISTCFSTKSFFTQPKKPKRGTTTFPRPKIETVEDKCDQTLDASLHYLTVFYTRCYWHTWIGRIFTMLLALFWYQPGKSSWVKHARCSTVSLTLSALCLVLVAYSRIIRSFLFCFKREQWDWTIQSTCCKTKTVS